jgi:hypothetical protein
MECAASSARVEGLSEPLKIKATSSFETSGTIYPVAKSYIPQGQNLRLYHCDNLKTHIFKIPVFQVVDIKLMSSEVHKYLANNFYIRLCYRIALQ